MIAARSPLLRFGAIVLAQVLGAACAQAQTLRHDVFERPALRNVQRAPAVAGQAGAAADTTPAWNPELRAVAVAGPDSLANVDGAIVRLGDEIDGYRLVEVRERGVVFVRGKKRYELALRGMRAPPAAQETPGRGAGAQAARAAPGAADMKSPGIVPEAPTASGTQGADTSTRGSK